MRQVLEGIRVLDFTKGMAGSVATMVLSDFGAEVVKVEPPGGDSFRAFPASVLWHRGKKSVCLDLSSPEGYRDALGLARQSDVVVVGLRPATVNRLRLGYETLKGQRPDLVYASITGFGSKGPYANYRGYEGLVQAKTGRLMNFAGQTPRQGPHHAAVKVANHTAAMATVRGVVAALKVRDRTGVGQLVETSLLQAVTYYDMLQWLIWQMMIKDPDGFPEDAMVNLRRSGPIQYLPARTKDGKWIQLANLMFRLFHAEIRALELDYIYEDPRFKTAPTLLEEDRDALRKIILERVGQKTLDEWMSVFVNDTTDVAAEPFMTSGEALDHVQMVHNGHVQRLFDPAVGPTRQLGPLCAMSATPPRIQGPAPKAGQHTAELLARLNGAERTDRGEASTGGLPGHPFEGVTVLDLSTVIAGPLGGSLLAELGARVIRIETLEGDWMRQMNNGIASNRTMAGTEGLSIDLKTPEGQAILYSLVEKVDVLMHNMRPGAPERLGVGLEQARKLNPNIVYVYVGGYGSTGPYHRRPAMHPIGGAVSGGATAQAGRDALPDPDAAMTMDEVVEVSRVLGRAQDVNPDPNTSMVASTAVALGLYARDRYGEGQYIETTMIGANAYANADDFFDYEGKPPREVSDAAGYGPNALYRLYEAERGWVYLACPLAREWRPLCEAVGQPDLADDPRFATADARRANDAELAGELAGTFASAPAPHWERTLTAADLGCVEVEERGMYHFFNDDAHVAENGFTTDVESERLGSFWRYSPVLKFSRTPSKAGPGITRGQHTFEILGELGYSREKVLALRDRRVLDWE